MKVARTVRRGADGKGPGNWYLAGGLPYYEDLQIRNMVKNHSLAKSISDASWGRFLTWMQYYTTLHGTQAMSVPPQRSSQECSGCGTLVIKTLSTWTHVCPTYGLVLDRDINAALVIRARAEEGRTVGQTGTNAPRSA